MSIDPAVFAAVASGLGVVGGMWQAWLLYRIKVKSMAHELALEQLHDCLDAHRVEAKAAREKLDVVVSTTTALAENSLVMHGQNQAAIAQNQATLERIEQEETAHHVPEQKPSG